MTDRERLEEIEKEFRSLASLSLEFPDENGPVLTDSRIQKVFWLLSLASRFIELFEMTRKEG